MAQFCCIYQTALENLKPFKKKTINAIYYIKIAKGEKAHDSLNGYRKAFGSIQYLFMKKRNNKPGMEENVHNVKEKNRQTNKDPTSFLPPDNVLRISSPKIRAVKGYLLSPLLLTNTLEGLSC